eukprot:CAMPEP_0119571594 /NCGR_PEP_ID=MMETSP1352-20130426/44201_1 /TAXON_ID=265584 /ORGANISM="Stauroneis constricta, Strain CCMP1120" /LENGTH=457 /DNA_ID=CAMNT_0007621277 /DNA_START=171 /DNA_END=1544 /DNA_ORIENTATION=+
MDSQEDPYQVLGVEKNATATDIKKAYRKLALKWHPDKQPTDDDKKKATAMFAKISNAYEILGDEQRRQEHDNQSNGRRRRQQQQQQTSTSQDPFPNARDFHFHDPFEIFAQVFRDDFARAANMHQQQHQQQHFASADPFQSMFGRMGGMMGGFGGMGGPTDMFSNSMFGGGGGMDPFASHMMMHQQAMGSMGMNGPSSTGATFSSSTSSTTSFGGGGRGGGNPIVSQSTSTSIVNGQRRTEVVIQGGGNPIVSQSTSTSIVNGQRRTEVVIQRADGTVERRVESATTGPTQPRQRLQQQLQQQQQQSQRQQPQQRQRQQLPSHSTGREAGRNGAILPEYATADDVCFGDDQHSGTKIFLKVLSRAQVKFPNDPDFEQSYSYIREKLQGRRFFLSLSDQTIPLREEEQVQDVIVQILKDHASSKPRSANGRKNQRAVPRGQSIEQLHDAERPPMKRQK